MTRVRDVVVVGIEVVNPQQPRARRISGSSLAEPGLCPSIDRLRADSEVRLLDRKGERIVVVVEPLLEPVSTIQEEMRIPLTPKTGI